MKKIIFDTDLGGDCDDVMALDILMAAHKAGECELLGVTYSSYAPLAPHCIRAITEYHGVSVPVGSCPTREGFVDTYSQAVVDAFPSCAGGDVEDSVKLMRRLLAKEDRVTIVATGSLYNIAALLKSRPDEISALDGMALVTEKVEEFAVMAGNFSHQSGCEPLPSAVAEDGTVKPQPEYNITLVKESSAEFFRLCPVPVVVSPFELGLCMYTGAPMCAAGKDRSPDSLSYAVHGSANGRDSWDPSTAFYALYGAAPYMYKTANGRITVDENGITDFIPGKGLHSVLYPAKPKAEFAKAMDENAMRLYR